MQIRAASIGDESSIRELYLETFDVSEAALVAQLACDLLEEPAATACLRYVAREGQSVLGHIAFSPVYCKDQQEPIGYILAPLAVHPSHQKQGIGKQLVERGLHELQQRNVLLILVYGDPQYYSRFGFEAEKAQGYLPPYPLQQPQGWLAINAHPTTSEFTDCPIHCVQAFNRPELW